MSELRRHIMMQQAGGESGYVRNGLVLWLDGIDKGTTPNCWTDLIGGRVFQINRGAPTMTQDGWYFDGSSTFFYNETLNGVYMLEACIELTLQNAIACQFGANPQIMLAGWNNTIQCGGNISQNFAGNLTTIKTISISRNLCYADFTQLQQVSNTDWVVNEGMYIGGRSNGYYTKGTIKSIRLYDRVLSVDEILHNQQVDNERFNLGL